MSVSARNIVAAFALCATFAFAAPAFATPPSGSSCNNCGGARPTPPPPPTSCNGCGTSHIVNTPSVAIAGPSIHVGGPSVHTSITHHSRSVSRSSRSYSFRGGDTYIFGRGGSYCCADQNQSSVVNNLTVYDRELLERSVTEIVAVRAVCIDEQGRPNPASRPSPDERVPDNFNGEIYRCMAGTSMQATIGEVSADGPNFDGGSTMTCAAGEALRYANGELRCATQEPRRNCNERSLLRRYGPGVKYIRITRTETYERETPVETAATTMVFDGGVGGVCGGC